jgi:hypothetical protein
MARPSARIVHESHVSCNGKPKAPANPTPVASGLPVIGAAEQQPNIQRLQKHNGFHFDRNMEDRKIKGRHFSVLHFSA